MLVYKHAEAAKLQPEVVKAEEQPLDFMDITFSPLSGSETAQMLESELTHEKISRKSIIMARISFYRSYRRLKLVPEKKATEQEPEEAKAS